MTDYFFLKKLAIGSIFAVQEVDTPKPLPTSSLFLPSISSSVTLILGTILGQFLRISYCYLSIALIDALSMASLDKAINCGFELRRSV